MLVETRHLPRREAIEAAAEALVANGIEPGRITKNMLLTKMQETGASPETNLAVKKSGNEATRGRPGQLAANIFGILTRTYHPPVRDSAELADRERQYNLRLYQLETEQFALRKAIEYQARQVVAIPVMVAVGALDGLFEAGVTGIAEVAETVSFAIARLIVRVEEGWQRGINSEKH